MKLLLHIVHDETLAEVERVLLVSQSRPRQLDLSTLFFCDCDCWACFTDAHVTKVNIHWTASSSWSGLEQSYTSSSLVKSDDDDAPSTTRMPRCLFSGMQNFRDSQGLGFPTKHPVQLRNGTGSPWGPWGVDRPFSRRSKAEQKGRDQDAA